MRAITKVAAGDSTIHVLPVIRGLTSEVSTVQDAFSSTMPDAVAISLSEEDRFGEVAAPPPCYVAAVEIADTDGTPVVPIDIDEASYTELYCASISGSALFRDSTRTWFLRKRAFSANTPEEYVLKVDRAFNNMRGFKNIEMQRADWMAKALLKIVSERERVLAVIELERAEDVLQNVKNRLAGSS
jgi:hypothetical protein